MNHERGVKTDTGIFEIGARPIALTALMPYVTPFPGASVVSEYDVIAEPETDASGTKPPPLILLNIL